MISGGLGPPDHRQCRSLLNENDNMEIKQEQTYGSLIYSVGLTLLKKSMKSGPSWF